MAIASLLSGLRERRLSFADGGEVKEDEDKSSLEEDKSSLEEDKSSLEEDKSSLEEDKSSLEEGPKGEDEPKEECSSEVNEIDADGIIDLFLEENPDLAERPVEEWPDDAIEALKSAINDEGIEPPDGELDTDEPAPEVIEETVIEEPSEEEPTTDVPNDSQDFDILELSKLVEAGDKDGAWSMLEDMFGVRPAEEPEPTNTLDRMVASDARIKKPSLGGFLKGLRF